MKILRYDRMGFLEHAGSRRYKHIGGVEEALLVAYLEQGCWLWLPPRVQFSIGACGASLSLCTWKPVIICS